MSESYFIQRRHYFNSVCFAILHLVAANGASFVYPRFGHPFIRQSHLRVCMCVDIHFMSARKKHHFHFATYGRRVCIVIWPVIHYTYRMLQNSPAKLLLRVWDAIFSKKYSSTAFRSSSILLGVGVSASTIGFVAGNPLSIFGGLLLWSHGTLCIVVHENKIGISAMRLKEARCMIWLVAFVTGVPFERMSLTKKSAPHIHTEA